MTFWRVQRETWKRQKGVNTTNQRDARLALKPKPTQQVSPPARHPAEDALHVCKAAQSVRYNGTRRPFACHGSAHEPVAQDNQHTWLWAVQCGDYFLSAVSPRRQTRTAKFITWLSPLHFSTVQTNQTLYPPQRNFLAKTSLLPFEQGVQPISCFLCRAPDFWGQAHVNVASFFYTAIRLDLKRTSDSCQTLSLGQLPPSIAFVRSWVHMGVCAVCAVRLCLSPVRVCGGWCSLRKSERGRPVECRG